MGKRSLFLTLASLLISISIFYGLEAMIYIVSGNLGKFLGSVLISVWSGLLGKYVIEEEL